MGASPEPLITVAAIVVGAGASGAISGVLKGVLPAIAPDIAGALVGGGLYFFGDRIHPLVKAFGVGVLAGSLKGTIEKAIPTGSSPVGPREPLGGSSSKSSGGSSTPAQTAAQLYVLTKGG